MNKVAASRPGRYDAVLMDIQMPVMNGYDATKAIRALASIPVVAMTANAMQEDIERARQCDMDGHIAKPIGIKAMLGTLDRILSKLRRARFSAPAGSRTIAVQIRYALPSQRHTWPNPLPFPLPILLLFPFPLSSARSRPATPAGPAGRIPRAFRQ